MPRSRKTEPRIWERSFLLNYFLLKAVNQQIKKRFPEGWRGRILDVGCGSMPYRKLFKGHYAEYIGCDEFPCDESVVPCSADHLVFPDHEYDSVVCFQVLEHVPRPWAVVTEASRVLKSGGFLLATVPFIFPHHPSPTDYYRYTHEGISQLATEAGLEIEEITVQCRSLTTMCLLINWYNGMVAAKLGKKRLTRPLGYLFLICTVVPINMLGWVLELLPLGRDHNTSNMGFANYLLIARKPSAK